MLLNRLICQQASFAHSSNHKGVEKTIMPDFTSNWLTASTIYITLRITQETLQEWEQDGKVTPILVGNKKVYNREQLVNLKRQQRAMSAPRIVHGWAI